MEPYVYPEGCVFKSLSDIAEKKITVMGLGLNGGGEACVKFFLKHGATVTVTDMKSAEQLMPTLKRLAEDSAIDKTRLSYVLGQHRIEDFENADCVIKNPGVKIQGNKYLAAAKAIETDLSIFLHFTKAPIIAVTGSKGKSSTVSAIHYGLLGAGFQSYLGGNITVSPLTFLEKTNGMTPVVLELSSWQLADLRGRKVLKPKIAIITKIVPDHQNWYGDMDSYVADKKLIYENQTKDDYTIVDFDPDDYLNETASPKHGCRCWGDVFASETNGTVLRYSKKMLPKNVFGVFQQQENNETIGYAQLPDSLLSNATLERKETKEKVMGKLKVPGEHMKTNVLNAALALTLMRIAPELTTNTLSAWTGIPHRLEQFFFASSTSNKMKVVFYNDTCATVPEAAVAAAKAFEHSIILICGGTDKDLDFKPLADLLCGKRDRSYLPKKVYLLAGTGTDKLISILNENHGRYSGPYANLTELLESLKEDLESPQAERVFGYTPGEDPLPVVFSPGATSFGMFANEFDRGDQFKKEVRKIF